MWFATKFIVFTTIVLGMSSGATETSDSAEFGGPLSDKDFKVRRIVQSMSAERIRNGGGAGDSILDDQLKWMSRGEPFGIESDDNGSSLRDKAAHIDDMIPMPSKKAGTSRLCGTKLVDAIVKLCNGCVKPAGGKAVTAKRSLASLMKRGQTLTEKCCINRCSFEDMKSFCCDSE